jgi:hypothetical protein
MKSIIQKSLIFGAVFIALMGFQSAKAQYNTGIGLRLGSGNGISVKHFVQPHAAVEGILYTRWSGFLLTGLYEVHKDIRGVRGLQWFYGGGAHFGTWNAGFHNLPWGTKRESHSAYGLSGIVGLDYKFNNSPINLSLDWKPAVNVTDDAGFWWDEVAFSMRFAF